jgi:hypothetical protein
MVRDSGVQRFLKNCTARSCFSAADLEEKVPKFLRFPVLAFFFREYKRYSPDFSLRIMRNEMLGIVVGLEHALEQLMRRPVNRQRDDDEISDQV